MQNTSKKNSSEILADFIECDRPIIYMECFDFDRVDEIILEALRSLKECAERQGDKREFQNREFSNCLGVIGFENKLPVTASVGKSLVDFLKDYTKPPVCGNSHRILILREIHDSIADKDVYSALQAIAKQTAKSGNQTVIIVDTRKVIPPELEKLVSVVDIEPPDAEEIKRLLQNTADEYGGSVEPKALDEVVEYLKGFSPFEIMQIARSAMLKNGSVIDKDCKAQIEEARQQAFKKSNLLELQVGEKNEPGGFEYFKEYLTKKKPIFQSPAEARKYGIKPPAGVVLLGMPGCGKSLSAYLVAKIFDCPLLKLDIGRLMGKYVGESEANLRRAIRIAEESAPCILWIDELEKAFSGINSGNSGSGEVMTRMFGSFLTWLQEKTKPVYVFATANDITNLPPEFLRRGRFDEIFKVGLPDTKGIEAIFKSCIEKRDLKCDINYKTLANRCAQKKYSGADIDCIVNDACEIAFNGGKRNLTTDDLIAVVRNTDSSFSADPKKYAAIEKILKERMAKDVSTGQTTGNPSK